MQQDDPGAMTAPFLDDDDIDAVIRALDQAIRDCDETFELKDQTSLKEETCGTRRTTATGAPGSPAAP
jgi:hypothetical protein